MLDLFIIFAMSLITFAVFGWDKHCATYNKWRVPEAVLLILAFLGGAFGALCAMIMFRHKTQHKKFTICVPIFLLLQIFGEYFFRAYLLN